MPPPFACASLGTAFGVKVLPNLQTKELLEVPIFVAQKQRRKTNIIGRSFIL